MKKIQKLLENEMIFDRFYHYLWVYHDFMKKQYGKIKVSIPDTIVFLR